jgi:ubiquinone/menaquinone biosynthesis C-methylase UbiE
MNWAKSLFVDNVRYYRMVLESQWKNGVENARLLSELFEEMGLKKCRVLDVPCGIGRIAVPLAKLGYEVAGVDISPYFVRMARQKARHFGVAKRTSFTVGSMKGVGSLFTDGQFDAAVNIFTSIGFGSENDDLAFFRGLRRVVRKGGLFVIGRLASRDFIFSHFSANLYDETERLVVLQQNELDVQGSRLKSRWRFYRKVGDSLRYATESSVDLRLYSPHELVMMLKKADWKVGAIYDSLTSRGEYSPDSRSMTVIAEAK